MKKWYVGLVIVFMMVIVMCYAQKPEKLTELKSFPVNDLEGIIAKTGVEFDKQISSDGKGSAKMVTESPTTINLYKAEKLDIDNARLVYQAKVKTEKMEGEVYLEMWCIFNGKGEYFSRGLDKKLTGTNDWTKLEIPFFLKTGEKPDDVVLNIVINGKGTVWIDDIRLLKGKLK